MDLGAGPIKVFFKIILPALIPAEIAALLLSFTMSLDDLVITSFIAGPDSTTLPMLIFSSVRRGLSPEINALATIIVLIVSIFTFFAWLSMVNKQKRKRQDAAKAAKAAVQEMEAHLHQEQEKLPTISQDYLTLLKEQALALQEGRDIADEIDQKWQQSPSNAQGKDASAKPAGRPSEESVSLADIAGNLPQERSTIVAESVLAQHKEQMKAKATKTLGDTAKEATISIQKEDLGHLKVKVVDKLSDSTTPSPSDSSGLSKPDHMPKRTTISSLEEAKSRAKAKANTMTSEPTKAPRETTTSSLAKAKAKPTSKATRAAAETSAVAVTKANTDLAKSSTEQAKVVDDTKGNS